ncbi:MAG: VirB3 family type IV secretion system protein [Proteobacteria bacterium]|nr:VirB3 family type IV secretion system protein [Pseudomonadota bacterium]
MRGTSAPYFKSLNRTFHILGVNRELFFLFVGLCLPIAFSARLIPMMDIVACGIFIVLHSIGVLVTRADSQMLAIYRRHTHTKKYYKAISGIHTKSPILKPSVPFYQGQRGIV